MAEEIKIATGHNNAANFVTFLVEPWCPLIVPGEITIGLSGPPGEDGWRSASLRWHPKVPNHVKVDALTKAGLTSGATIRSGNVTVRLPANTDRTIYANYNAITWYNEADEFERGGSGFEISLIKLDAI